MNIDTKDIYEIGIKGKEIRFIYCNEKAAQKAWKKQEDKNLDLSNIF